MRPHTYRQEQRVIVVLLCYFIVFFYWWLIFWVLLFPISLGRGEMVFFSYFLCIVWASLFVRPSWNLDWSLFCFVLMILFLFFIFVHYEFAWQGMFIWICFWVSDSFLSNAIDRLNSVASSLPLLFGAILCWPLIVCVWMSISSSFFFKFLVVFNFFCVAILLN